MKNGGTAVNSDFKEHNTKNLLRKALLKSSNECKYSKIILIKFKIILKFKS